MRDTKAKYIRNSKSKTSGNLTDMSYSSHILLVWYNKTLDMPE